MEGVLAIICAVGLPLFLAIMAAYMSIKSRHAERMALIERGVSLNEAKAPRIKANPNRHSALRNGLVLMGFAVGLLIGIFVYPSFPEDNFYSEAVVPAFSILFGGIAFVIYFLIALNLDKKKEGTQEENAVDEDK